MMDGVAFGGAGFDSNSWSIDDFATSAAESLQQTSSEYELSTLFGGNDSQIDSMQWSPVDAGWGSSGTDFSNPGSIGEPSASQIPGGYGSGEASGPEDTGKLGGAQSDTAEFDAILRDPNASLEEKIFALLMKLQKTKEGEVESSVKKMDKNMAGRADVKKAGGDVTTTGTSEQRDMIDFQKVQGELTAINQLTSQMLNTFKQMRDAVIQNLR